MTPVCILTTDPRSTSGLSTSSVAAHRSPGCWQGGWRRTGRQACRASRSHGETLLVANGCDVNSRVQPLLSRSTFAQLRWNKHTAVCSCRLRGRKARCLCRAACCIGVTLVVGKPPAASALPLTLVRVSFFMPGQEVREICYKPPPMEHGSKWCCSSNGSVVCRTTRRITSDFCTSAPDPVCAYIFQSTSAAFVV